MNESKEEGEKLLIWWKTPALTEFAQTRKLRQQHPQSDVLDSLHDLADGLGR